MNLKTVNIINNNKIFSKKNLFITNIFPEEININDFKKISNDSLMIFSQYNFGNYNIPHQGFKIHVSTTISNYQNILNIVFKYCKINKITFKTISSVEYLKYNLMGFDNLWSTGKFITIYPENVNMFKLIIDDLYNNETLFLEDGVSIYTDRKYKDSRNLFYRYGILSNDGDLFLYNSENKVIKKDYEIAVYSLPNFISEPFKVNFDDSLKSNRLYKTYYPQKSLSHKVANPVFVAKTVRGDEVILKTAKHGYGDSENSFIQRLKFEKENLLKYSKFNFIPKLIDSFFEDKDYFIVEQKMPGISIDMYRSTISEKLFLNINKRDIIFKLRDIMIDCISKIKKLHNEHIMIGDISSQNVLIDTESSKVFFIDLDQTHIINKRDIFNTKKKITYRTEGFYNNSIDFLDDDKQDWQQLGYLFMALFCRSNNYLYIDKTGEMSNRFFEKYAEIYHLPRVFVKVINTLIYNTDFNDYELINILKNEVNFSGFIRENYIEDKHNIDQMYICLKQTEILTNFHCRNKENINLSIENLNKSSKSTKINNHSKISIYLMKNDPKIRVLFSDVKYKRYFENELNKYIQILKKNKNSNNNLYLKDFISLFIDSIYVFHNFNYYKGYELIKSGLKEIMTVFGININGYYAFKSSSKSMLISPYLSDGLSGIFLIILKMREWYDANFLKDLSNEIASTLISFKMPQSASFSWGLSGILWVLLEFKKVDSIDKYEDYIRESTYELKYYMKTYRNNMYVVDESFKLLNTSFEHGNSGILFYLNEYRRNFK